MQFKACALCATVCGIPWHPFTIDSQDNERHSWQDSFISECQH